MKKFISGLIIINLIIILNINVYSEEPDSKKEVTILFTHDLHSNIDPITLNNTQIGGFAKIKTIIDTVKSKSENTIVVDGGDFSMGTLYQTEYEKEAFELRLLGLMGYDVTTIGNHEFDYGSDGLSNMLTAAKNSNEKLPALVSSNINLEKSDKKYEEKLKKAMDYYGAKKYIILNKGNVKIAVFGLMGEDAGKCTVNNEIVFDDAIESAKDTVKKIKKNEDVDLIICLSHSGTNSSIQKSEDEKLANEVPDINIIVSGHTHTILEKPIKVNNTYIVSAGAYGKKVGKINLLQSRKGEWKVKEYELITVDSSVKPNIEIENKITGFRLTLQEYLDYFGYYNYSQIIAYSPYNFTKINNIYNEHCDQSIGNLISDAYIYAVKNAEGDKYKNIDISIVSSGLIRSSISVGYLSVSDVFKIMSLGKGPNGIPGYPLTSIYLTGKELKSIAEIDASIATVIPTMQLYCRGLNYEFNLNRLFYYRLTDIKIETENGELLGIDNDKLYRVVTGLWTAKMLSTIEQKYTGINKITPKFSNGEEIKDFNKAIIYENGKELKEWYALASYLQSFDKVDGVSVIPKKYSASMERKTVNENSFSLYNKKFIALFLSIIVFISVIFFVFVNFKAINLFRKNRIRHKKSGV